LGQLPWIHPQEEVRRSFWRELLPRLKNHSWASYHDRYSGSVDPDLGGTQQRELISLPQVLSADQILKRFYSQTSTALAAHRSYQLPIELEDHETLQPWPAPHSTHYWVWELFPGSFHLIEGLRSLV